MLLSVVQTIRAPLFWSKLRGITWRCIEHMRMYFIILFFFCCTFLPVCWHSMLVHVVCNASLSRLPICRSVWGKICAGVFIIIFLFWKLFVYTYAPHRRWGIFVRVYFFKNEIDWWQELHEKEEEDASNYFVFFLKLSAFVYLALNSSA